MANIITSGCFDVFHEGHKLFLRTAKHYLGAEVNKLIVCVNTSNSARKLKAEKWGEKYPIHDTGTRMANVKVFADFVVGFETEDDLRTIILSYMPCILVKGPDYAGKRVTGDVIAPLLILDTPEPESVKEMKKRVYA